MPDTAEKTRDLKPFVALEAATLISGTGNGVAAIALPWLTLQLTDDPAAAGLVVAVAALPQLAASLGSGVIIDRLGRQRTSVGSDAFSAVSAALIPVFGLLGVLTYPLVMFASVLGAIFDPVGVTAREAMLPDVAKRGGLQLERVNGIHEAIWGLAWLIGPGVAGVLIGLVGATMSFWAMAAGFAISAVLVAAVCMPTPPARESEAHWVAEAIDGWKCLLHTPALRATTVLSTLAFMLAYSVVGVVLPVVYERIDQPEALGVLFMAYSGAGVGGALIYGALGSRIPRRAAFVTGLAVSALVPLVFVFSASYAVQLAVMAVAGLLSAAVNPVLNVVVQERVPDEMRGRVLSAVFALAYAAYPVGYAAGGFTIKWWGETATLAWMGGATLLVAAWGLVTPALRGLDAFGDDKDG